MLHEHQSEYASQWAAIQSISAKIGCTPETLRRWLRATEKTSVAQAELTTTERERLKALEREVRELRQANELLRKASAYFAQAELDRPFKR
jgi:transposase